LRSSGKPYSAITKEQKLVRIFLIIHSQKSKTWKLKEIGLSWSVDMALLTYILQF